MVSFFRFVLVKCVVFVFWLFVDVFGLGKKFGFGGGGEIVWILSDELWVGCIIVFGFGMDIFCLLEEGGGKEEGGIGSVLVEVCVMICCVIEKVNDEIMLLIILVE